MSDLGVSSRWSAVHNDLPQDFMVPRARDESDERSGNTSIIRHQNDVVLRVKAQLVCSRRVRSRSTDRCGDLIDHLSGLQVQHPYRAVSITDPNVSMVDDQHAIGARAVIGACTNDRWWARRSADESWRKLVYESVAAGIDDVDRFVRAVGQDVDPSHRINEPDVKGLETCDRDG